MGTLFIKERLMQPSAATNSTQALSNLQTFQQGMKTPDQLLQADQSGLGVNQAQQQVQGLRSAITNTTNLLQQVAPSIQGRTANSLVTTAQADKQVANESAPIQSNLTTQEGNYNEANQDYSNLEQQAEAKANAEEQGNEQQLSTLQNIYGDLYTQEQNTLQQQQAAAAEAEQKREFDAQLAASNAAAGSNASSYIPAGTGNSGPAGAKATDPNEQAAYNNLQQIKASAGNNAQAVISDYRATLDSALRGNAVDKLKVGMYKKLFPQLFPSNGPINLSYNGSINWGI